MSEILILESVDSTNKWLAERGEELEDFTAVMSVSQTSGRGQRGNSWESEPGKNITCSILYKPEDYRASRQFQISERVALGVVDLLAEYGIEAKVKWPNDVYVGDKKICGILIEHSVMGMNIRHSILGIGLNVNQEVFVSDAPNPVSMRNITGGRYDVWEVMEMLHYKIMRRMEGISDAEGGAAVHEEFKKRLWRREGVYGWKDAAGDFLGEIADVEMQGYLIIRDIRGKERKYAFKEVEYLGKKG